MPPVRVVVYIIIEIKKWYSKTKQIAMKIACIGSYIIIVITYGWTWDYLIF